MSGRLLFDGDWIYTFTKADRDTMVRCIYGESGADACAEGKLDGLAVLVCMVNRWTMLLTLPWYRKLLLKDPEAKVYGYNTFNDFLHAYSQPINYAWLNGGKFDHDPDHVDAGEKRRAELLERSIDRFPRSIRDTVDECLCFSGDFFSTATTNGTLGAGVPAGMAGLVHFYCPAIYYARKLGVRPRDLTSVQVETANKEHFGNPDKGLIYAQPVGCSPRSNAFYKVKRTRNWRPEIVRVVP
jgi:hypothetical protein